MEIKFGIELEDYDEVTDRLSDLRMKFVINVQTPANNKATVRLFVDTYKDMANAFYVTMMFAMLRDE